MRLESCRPALRRSASVSRSGFGFGTSMMLPSVSAIVARTRKPRSTPAWASGFVGVRSLGETILVLTAYWIDIKSRPQRFELVIEKTQALPFATWALDTSGVFFSSAGCQ